MAGPLRSSYSPDAARSLTVKMPTLIKGPGVAAGPDVSLACGGWLIIRSFPILEKLLPFPMDAVFGDAIVNMNLAVYIALGKIVALLAFPFVSLP